MSLVDEDEALEFPRASPAPGHGDDHRCHPGAGRCLLLRLLLLPRDHAATRAVHDRGGDAADQAGRRVDQRLQRDQPPRPRAVHLQDGGPARLQDRIRRQRPQGQDDQGRRAHPLRTGGEESAKLLAQHIKGAKPIQDKRKGDAIDLALGTTWKGFGPVPTPTT